MLSPHSVTNTSPSTLLRLGNILVVSFVLDTEHTLLRLGDLVKRLWAPPSRAGQLAFIHFLVKPNWNQIGTQLRVSIIVDYLGGLSTTSLLFSTSLPGWTLSGIQLRVFSFGFYYADSTKPQRATSMGRDSFSYRFSDIANTHGGTEADFDGTGHTSTG